MQKLNKEDSFYLTITEKDYTIIVARTTRDKIDTFYGEEKLKNKHFWDIVDDLNLDPFPTTYNEIREVLTEEQRIILLKSLTLQSIQNRGLTHVEYEQ